MIKNRIYVQPFGRGGWAQFLETVPRDLSASLLIHEIPDGSYLTDPMDLDNKRLWPDEDGINVMGTPLDTPDFIDSYLFGKGIKHRQLLSFIHEIATAGHPREAIAMLTGASCPRLTHLINSTEKNKRTKAWMYDMDYVHVSTWLHCLCSSSNLDQTLGPDKKDILSD